MRIGDSLTPINHETIANVLCNVARQDAFPLQTDWFVELDKEESREDEPETLEMQLSAKSIEISCFHCMSANLTGFTLNTQFFVTQQSHMMDTPSVAPRSTSTTKIELRFFSHTHTHTIQLEQEAQAFDHLDDCDIFKGHSHVYCNGE